MDDVEDSNYFTTGFIPALSVHSTGTCDRRLRESAHTSRSRVLATFLAWCQPDWLVNDYSGKMPCLTDNGEVYTESDKIAQYLEYFYPSPTLSLQENPERVDQVITFPRVFPWSTEGLAHWRTGALGDCDQRASLLNSWPLDHALLTFGVAERCHLSRECSRVNT